MLRSLLALSLVGCGVTAPPQPFALCAVPEGGFVDPEALFTGVSVTVQGLVTASGVGDTPDHCFDNAGRTSSGELDRSAAWWFREADDEGVSWTFGVWLPDDQDVPAVGDPIHASFFYQAGGFGPTRAHLAIANDHDALREWLGVAADLPELPVPTGLHVARGDVVARHTSSCGDWASYAMEVGTYHSGDTLDYGERLDVAGLEFRHGGYDQATRQGQCPDWFVANVALAILPAP